MPGSDTEDAAGSGAPVPPAETLERLAADDWALLLRQIRAALHELEDHLLTPRLVQLRAAPTSRLLAGRSRRDLCRALAAGGPLWHATVAKLTADEETARRFAWLLAGGEPTTVAAAPTPPAPSPRSEAEQRLRARLRAVVRERDDALRRASGLEARLQSERERLAGVETARLELVTERDELARRLAEAEAEREQVLERLRRQHEAELARARDELRALRRAEDERRQRRERRREAREAVERQAARTARAEWRSRRPRRLARPGRPSRLPAGVSPGSVAEVEALLAPGRQVVVDGYNVTRQHRDHLALEQQRRWLFSRLEALVARTGTRCTVVFDGDPTAGPQASPSRTVSVRFATESSADDLIVALAAGLAAEEPLVVVTDDRELHDRLVTYRVDVVGTRPFLEVLG